MPGKKNLGYTRITVSIRPDQKDEIEKEKADDFSATQDSIVRDALDEHFERKDKK